MKWKILLVVLLLSLGTGFYLAKQMGVFETKPQERPEVEKLMSFDLDELDRVRISFLDTTYAMRRNFSEWMIEEPYAGEMADSFTVNSILRSLTRISVLRKIPVDSLSLAQVNLDNPVMSFEMTFKDGRTGGVDFGVLNPTTDNIYTRRTGADSVILISRVMGPTLAVTGRMIRSRQLVNLPVLRAARVEIESPAGGFSLVRDRKSLEWWLDSPGGRTEVDMRPILILLERLHLAEVREFRPLDTASGAETGLNRPVCRLLVEDLDGGRNEILLGNYDRERRYLRWASSTVYPNDLLLVDSLLVGQFARINPQNLEYIVLAPIDVHLVNRIAMKYQDAEVDLVADSDTLWRLVKPSEHAARLWQVERILTQVDTMQAIRTLPRTESGRGFENPQLDLGLYRGDSLMGRYQIGDYAGNNIYFRDVLRGKDFIVPPRTLERLSWTFDDLADIPVKHVVQ